MKRTFRTTLATFAAAALVLAAGQSFAAGTEADTVISNTASVAYTIAGTPTTTPSNTQTFLVDRMINPVVANTGAATVVAGGTDYALPFTVTNLSNTPLATDEYFTLTTNEVTANIMTNVRIYSDVNADGLLDGGDTLVNAPVLIVRDDTTEFLIVADVLAAGGTPDTGTPLLTAPYDLVATAWAGAAAGAGALAADADATNDAATSEIVFADANGTAGDGGANNGSHADRGTYTTAATLGVAKSVSNGGSGYQIPGDTVTYTVAVSNADTTNAATGVVMTDPVPANTVYVSGSLGCTTGTPQWSIDGTNYVAVEPGAGVTHVRCDGGTVAASATETMDFDVTIQ